MESFIQPIQVRWADMDPNFHVRHSVYYDWGASCRFEYLNAQGLTTALLQRLSFGPILFREECIFRKEVKYGDIVTINLKLMKGKRDFSRWTIGHQIKKEDDILCALLQVDGAWLNTTERKLKVPPEEVRHIFELMPRDADFQWIDK